MAKSFLILMLMTTQLLAGSGNPVYLCIGNDGSYSIRTEADSCASSDVDCGAGCHSCSEASSGRHGSQCSKHPEDRLASQNDDALSLADSCDCTHIPVTMAFDQPTRATRDSVLLDFESLSLLVVQAPMMDVACQRVLQLTFHSYDTSRVPDLTLIVVSTVVIRC